MGCIEQMPNFEITFIFIVRYNKIDRSQMTYIICHWKGFSNTHMSLLQPKDPSVIYLSMKFT